jgi:hypothetical protein
MNENCVQAHEPGEEIEAAPGTTAREEMSTLKHAIKESETRKANAGESSFMHRLPWDVLCKVCDSSRPAGIGLLGIQRTAQQQQPAFHPHFDLCFPPPHARKTCHNPTSV